MCSSGLGQQLEEKNDILHDSAHDFNYSQFNYPLCGLTTTGVNSRPASPCHLGRPLGDRWSSPQAGKKHRYLQETRLDDAAACSSWRALRGYSPISHTEGDRELTAADQSQARGHSPQGYWNFKPPGHRATAPGKQGTTHCTGATQLGGVLNCIPGPSRDARENTASPGPGAWRPAGRRGGQG